MRHLFFYFLFIVSSFCFSSNALNILVKDVNGDNFVLSNESLGSSIKTIANNMGYSDELYHQMILTDRNDIFAIIMKSFSNDVICVISLSDSLTNITQKEINDIIGNDHPKIYSYQQYESDIEDAIENKSITLEYMCDLLGIVQNNQNQLYDEKYGYHLYFENGILVSFEHESEYKAYTLDWFHEHPKIKEQMECAAELAGFESSLAKFVINTQIECMLEIDTTKLKGYSSLTVETPKGNFYNYALIYLISNDVIVGIPEKLFNVLSFNQASKEDISSDLTIYSLKNYLFEVNNDKIFKFIKR